MMNVTFACSFHNRRHGTNTYIMGREASLEVAERHCRLYSAEWKPEYAAKLCEGAGGGPGMPGPHGSTGCGGRLLPRRRACEIMARERKSKWTTLRVCFRAAWGDESGTATGARIATRFGSTPPRKASTGCCLR